MSQAHTTSRHGCLKRIGIVICVLMAGCSGPNHPNHARYEYLYIGGIFQSPYQAFPQGAERDKWKCYDKKLQSEFSCTMVRGGWQHFDYIYRERK